MPDGDNAGNSDYGTEKDYNDNLLRKNGNKQQKSKKLTSSSSHDDTAMDTSKVDDPMANNEDRLRKIAHLQEKQDQLKQKKRRKYVEKRAKSEATRYRARAR